MIRRPPGSTRTDTLFPDTTLFRSMLLATFNDREFVRVANVVGHPDWADDVRFSRSASRVANRRILAECLQEALSSRSQTEWIEKINAANVSCGPINRLADIERKPQVNRTEERRVGTESGRQCSTGWALALEKIKNAILQT